MTLARSLKIVPRYEGNKKVIQHGANRARDPAKKEATRDTPKASFDDRLNSKSKSGIGRVVSAYINIPGNGPINRHNIGLVSYADHMAVSPTAISSTNPLGACIPYSRLV